MSTTELKLLALITMLIDHIGLYIPNTPVYLRYIGRLSAPIFLFCAVVGFINTHDKKKYMIRIYLFSVFMGFIEGFILYDDINYIRTIFMTIIVIFVIDNFRTHNPLAKKYFYIFLIWQVFLNIFFIIFYNVPTNVPSDIFRVLVPLLTVPLFMDYGLPFVILGVCMYLFLNSRKKFSISYCTVTLCILILQNTMFLRYVQIKGRIWLEACEKFLGIGRVLSRFHYDFMEFIPAAYLDIEVRSLENNLFYTAQWLMICALPFLLIYNGKKGKGMKYLFYIMYPLNIVVLNYIGQCMTT